MLTLTAPVVTPDGTVVAMAHLKRMDEDLCEMVPATTIAQALDALTLPT